MQEEGAAEEGDDDIAASYHRDDGNHGTLLAQRLEVGKVGNRQEERDEQDGPAPLEGLLLALRKPEDKHHAAHNEHDINIAPCLHQHIVELPHECFVVERADSSQQRSRHSKPYPTVMLEVNALLLSTQAEHIEGDDGKGHTYPLPGIKPLAEDEQGAQQHHNGTRGVDGADDGDGQVLHAEIAEGP